jgi:DNA-binding MarR family transcriptional regulator
MPPAHKRKSGAEPIGKTNKRVNKRFAKEAVAHPSVTAPVVSGAGLAVLLTLSRFRHPLAPSEIVQHSGLARRTVFRWLSKLLRLGYVERIGKPRSPGVLYALTGEGRRALTSARSGTVFTGQARTKPRLQNLQNSNSSPERACKTCKTVKVSASALSGHVKLSEEAGPARLVLPLTVTLDGSARGRLELAMRASYAPVRGYLGSLGVNMPRKRVKSVVCYASNGKIHFDMPVSPDVLSAVDHLENAVLLSLSRVWLVVVAGVAVLTAAGVPPERVCAALCGVLGYFASHQQNLQNA